ncbi:MAG TPA: glycosyltransferase family 4 protein [Coxiellaceae bacterium]|nr:glycosyltransferase family 4 protein [Coxiellaceae bacterium]
MIYLFLFLSSLILTRFYYSFSPRLGFVDIPNHRSSHVQNTPRGGGMVFMLLWLIYLAVSQLNWPIFFSGLIVALLGFLDDAFGLGRKIRFLFQIGASLLFIFLIGGISDYHLIFTHVNVGIVAGSCLAVLSLLWSTNLFNFMDGIDGIASVEALFLLLPLSFLAVEYHAISIAILCSSLATVILGFLWWNWPKARVFMGDIGSSCLGFLIAAFALLLQSHFEVPIIYFFMLYGAFLFDATVTLLRRILAKECWYKAHRQHAYQRMQNCGWSHLKILGWIILINTIITSLVFLTYHHYLPLLLSIAIEFLLLVLVYVWVEKKSPMMFEPKELVVCN